MPGNNIQDTNLDAMENDDFEVEVKVTASAFELEIEGDSDVILDENVLMSSQGSLQSLGITEEEDDSKLDEITNILELSEDKFPLFTLAKNKARFLRMVSWYRGKEELIEVAPLSGVTKLFKQQTKELEGIRSSKLDYEMELETGTLTPSQRSYRRDELKMCKVQEKMAVHLISKLQVKIKSGRR